MSIAEKLQTVAENEQRVYDAGYDKGIALANPVEASGMDIVTLEGVHPTEHDIEVKLSSDTVTDFSGVSVTACGKNLFDGSLLTGYFNNVDFEIGNNVHTVYRSIKVYLERGTYTFSWGEAVNIVRLIKDGSFSMVGLIGVTNYSFTATSDGYFGLSFRNAVSDETAWNDDTAIQLEAGDVATTYEIYTDPTTYMPDADGAVKVKSISPTTIIKCDTSDVNITAKCYQDSYDTGFAGGKQAEYDDFWSTVRFSGFMMYAFAGSCWNDTTFKPPLNTTLSPTYAGSMFARSFITDVKGILEERGITLDFSKSTSFNGIVEGSTVTRLGTIDTTSCASLQLFLYSANSLVSIDKIIFKDDGTQTATTANAFSCKALAEIYEIEGKWGYDLNLQNCPNISVETTKRFIDALVPNSGRTLVLNDNTWTALEAEGRKDGLTWKDYVTQQLGYSI